MKILNKEQIKAIGDISDKDKIVFVNIGYKISWIRENGVIINIQSKQKRLAFDECLIGYTSYQYPIFLYTINDKEILLIRGKNRNCIYTPKTKEKKGIIYHPPEF